MPGKKLPESESVANSFQPVKRGKPTRTLTRQLQILQIRIFREINLDRRNGFFCAVDKVMATFESIHPLLIRKVTFLDLTPHQGEWMADFCRRLDTVAEIADMAAVTLNELKVIRVAQSCADKDLKGNYIDLKKVEQSWEKVK